MTIKGLGPLQHPSDSGAGDGTPAAAAAAADKPAGDKPAAEKPAGDKPAGDGTVLADGKKTPDAAAKPESKAGEEKPAPKAPEKYALTLPDDGRLDASDLKTIEEIARKADWTNEEAQAAVDEHIALIAQQSERFLTATKADKDYGGEKLAETQKLARAVIDRIRPVGHARRGAFVQFLNRGGAGNHIEVVSFLADLGKLMAEDGATGGRGGGSGKPKTAEEVLYGSG